MFIAFCVPIIACAAPEPANGDMEEKEESFLAYFNIHDDILDLLDGEKQVDDKIADALQEDDINTFTYLNLNKGFRKIEKTDDNESTHARYFQVAPTFSDTKDISGEGEENTVVGIMVCKIDEDNTLKPTFFTERQKIGPSKLYNESIELKSIGGNMIILAVKKGEKCEHKVYYINRKKADTKELLENIDVGFDVEEDNEQDNTFDSFFKEYTDDNQAK